MLTIDIHTHILPPSWPNLKQKYGYGGFAQLEHHGPGCARMIQDDKVFREVHANCWDAATRLQECDADGVHMQVLSTAPVMFCYWAKPEHTLDLARFLNDHIAETVAAHPKRFVGLGTLPMQSPDLAIAELERCVKQLGLAGIQIGTHVNGWNLDEPALFPIFEAAAELNAAIFVHPWDMLGMDRMKKYWLPWLVGMPSDTAVAIASVIFSGLLEKLPKLRLAFAHGGGSFPAIIGRIEQGFTARPDLCAQDNSHNPRHYLSRIYVDSLVHEPHMLRYLLQLLGPTQIALGSDYPFPLGETTPGTLIRSLQLGEATQARLLHGTALEWLGKKISEFE